MRRLLASVVLLTGSLSLGGCAVVSATANVVGAAGTLVGATANVAAGAIGAVAGGKTKPEKKPACADKSDDKGCADAQP